MKAEKMKSRRKIQLCTEQPTAVKVLLQHEYPTFMQLLHSSLVEREKKGRLCVQCKIGIVVFN